MRLGYSVGSRAVPTNVQSAEAPASMTPHCCEQKHEPVRSKAEMSFNCHHFIVLVVFGPVV